MSDQAFQDQLEGNFCWGCGPTVEGGLRIKSFWAGDETVSDWTPRSEFAAGPKDVLFGGTIGSLMDCHGIWTAIADAYRREERDIGSGTPIWYVTASLQVQYRKPTPIDLPLSLVGRATEASERKTLVSCSLTSDGVERATAELVAVRVPLEWFTGQHG